MGARQNEKAETPPSTDGSLRAVRSVIFDCDGVMFDTAGVNRAYYNHLLASFGRPEMTDAQFRFVHMHTVDEALAHLFPDAQRLQSVRDFRSGMDYRPFLRHLVIEPHLKPLLKRLRPQCKTAVATNRTDTMEELLKLYRLENCFDIVVRACDVARPKPHPDPLLRVLETFGIEAQEAIYIGDSAVDEAAASAAGIPFIAYRNRGLQATRHIRHLSEIEVLLDL